MNKVKISMQLDGHDTALKLNHLMWRPVALMGDGTRRSATDVMIAANVARNGQYVSGLGIGADSDRVSAEDTRRGLKIYPCALLCAAIASKVGARVSGLVLKVLGTRDLAVAHQEVVEAEAAISDIRAAVKTARAMERYLRAVYEAYGAPTGREGEAWLAERAKARDDWSAHNARIIALGEKLDVARMSLRAARGAEAELNNKYVRDNTSIGARLSVGYTGEIAELPHERLSDEGAKIQADVINSIVQAARDESASTATK